ncbi:MAG: hypothetical protein K2M60_03960 [Lachnospiraceae bacterium]|nr:hypothetical protein [Lachnospiraceae bacterium]MDE6254323.1 hypothetical protein [Lachnospiraceae bacterium]
MKKRIAGIIIVISVIMCGVICFMRQPDDAKAENVDNTYLLKESTNPIITSPSPFDYVDKESYNNILAMGTDAIKPLQEQFDSEETSAMLKYVCGALLEQITQCYVTNGTSYRWSNVQEFEELWTATIDSLPETLENIQNDDSMSVEEKQAELEKYGVFGKVFAKEAMKTDFEMGSWKMRATDDKDVKAMYSRLSSEVSDKDVKNVIEYFDYKCK